MPKVTHVKKARNTIKGTGIKKGDSYYWWKFRYGSKQVSKTYPKPQQLTQSGFKISVYDISDKISAIHQSDSAEELSNDIEEIAGDIRDLAEEQEEKRNNMPEHLQDVGTGELLQNRIDSLEEWASELEGINIDEDDLQNSLDELQQCSYNGE